MSISLECNRLVEILMAGWEHMFRAERAEFEFEYLEIILLNSRINYSLHSDILSVPKHTFDLGTVNNHNVTLQLWWVGLIHIIFALLKLFERALVPFTTRKTVRNSGQCECVYFLRVSCQLELVRTAWSTSEVHTSIWNFISGDIFIETVTRLRYCFHSPLVFFRWT